MNKKIIGLVAVVLILALAFIPCGVEADVISPQLNRTYPHSTHLKVEVDHWADPINCTIQYTWLGDPTLHGDWDYPPFTSELIDDPSCVVANSGYYLDVDFDVQGNGGTVGE